MVSDFPFWEFLKRLFIITLFCFIVPYFPLSISFFLAKDITGYAALQSLFIFTTTLLVPLIYFFTTKHKWIDDKMRFWCPIAYLVFAFILLQYDQSLNLDLNKASIIECVFWMTLFLNFVFFLSLQFENIQSLANASMERKRQDNIQTIKNAVSKDMREKLDNDDEV